MKHHFRFATHLAALGIIFATTALIANTVSAAEPVQLFNPLAATVDPNAPIQSLSALFINVLFGIAGAVALAMYVWGGALWLGSAGEEKMVTKGKAVFQWTTLGIIMMFSAYTLVSYLFGSFGTGAVGGATGGAGGSSGGSGSAASATSGSGAATGNPATPGSATVDTSICCVDYATNKSATKQSASACTGSSSKVLQGKCENLTFCQVNSGTSSNVICSGFLQESSCNGAVTYSSFGNCMFNVQAAATVGAGTTGTKTPYCCVKIGAVKGKSGTKNFAGASEQQAINDAAAQNICTSKGYNKYFAGECTSANLSKYGY